MPQHPLNIELSSYKKSFINLNTLVFIENDFFFELLRKVNNQKKKYNFHKKSLWQQIRKLTINLATNYVEVIYTN